MNVMDRWVLTERGERITVRQLLARKDKEIERLRTELSATQKREQWKCNCDRCVEIRLKTATGAGGEG